MANTRVVSFHAEGIKTREVWNMKYTLSQQTDVEGQPTGCTRGGKITVKVKARDDGNNDMLEWMADSFLSKDGYILGYRSGNSFSWCGFWPFYCCNWIYRR